MMIVWDVIAQAGEGSESVVVGDLYPTTQAEAIRYGDATLNLLGIQGSEVRAFPTRRDAEAWLHGIGDLMPCALAVHPFDWNEEMW